MGRSRALRGYAVLCGSLGIGLFLAGLFFYFLFFAYHAPASDLAIPTGPVGFYFVAFAGSALMGWGGALLAASRRPEAARGIGTASAVALVSMALHRMLAWVTGDYYAWLGELLRVESAVCLLLALAFVWLRPPRRVVGEAG